MSTLAKVTRMLSPELKMLLINIAAMSAHAATAFDTRFWPRELQLGIKRTQAVSSKLPLPTLPVLLQVITTFLGSLLVGSFLNQISRFLDNPGGVVNTLGSSAPQTATFFMTFILIQAFIKQPLQLLRLPGLIFFWLKSRFATTNRQKAALWKDARLKYGRNVSVPSELESSELKWNASSPIV